MKNVQRFAIFVFAIALAGEVRTESEDIPEPLPVPLPLIGSQSQLTRQKRDLSFVNDALDAAGSLGVGGGYIKKFKNLINGVPPKMQDALLSQDFSNVTVDDMRNLNVSVLEYLPPSVISSLNLTLLAPVIDKLLVANKPMALGRVMTAVGEKMDSKSILDNLQSNGGISDNNEEAASVMLYTALNKLGDKGGIDTSMIRRLSNDGLLGLVPEEQLMKVTDPNAAKQLLNRIYQRASGNGELEDVDDQALMFKLVETGYGKAESWSQDTIKSVGTNILAQMPSEFLKNLNPEAVTSSISSLKDVKFENPLQAKSITDVFLEKSGVSNTEGAESAGAGGFASIIGALGPLAAFVNPALSKDTSILSSIVSACDKLNLPAPLMAIAGIIKQKTQGGKSIKDLGYDDMKEMGISVLKNGPPSLLSQAMDKNVLSEDDLNQIGKSVSSTTENNGGAGGIFSSPFFQGIIAQVSAYAMKFFTQGGRINFEGLPGAFLGALGIKGINDMDNRDLSDDVLKKLKENPDSLDDAQKAMLLKRLKDAGMLDSSDLPPEIRALQPRKKGDDVVSGGDDVLDGLPSDAELRLAHGNSKKKVTARDLEMDRYLVGTLSVQQVNQFDLEEIPAVLAVVRKAKDGPQAQTLEALSKRFAEYVRLKSEDYESPDKKLLKYISAAEVSKLPATVLAYFIDHRQTSKLPPAVRKEIMIAMGELSTKDHATIPGKTREEIILQGLAALDSLSSPKKLDVPELAAIGAGVSDLPPEKIEKLTPVAAEQALEIIKGTADDDDDGLKQRACLKPEQKRAWRKKVIELYGEPSTWDPATVTSLCCATGLLNTDDLMAIAPDALATCRCASDEAPPSHLSELKKALDANCKHELGTEDNSKKIVAKVKSEIPFDLDDLESQIISRRRRSADDKALSCFRVRLTGSAEPFTKEQLETLPEAEIHECIYELGKEPLPLEDARVLWKKLVGSKGSVESLSADDYRFAGYVLSGITLSDASKLNMGDWDIVFPFGKSLGLSKNVLEKLAAQLEEKQKPLPQFTSNDLAVSRNILCGFTPEKLSEIDISAFRDALPVLKSLDASCEQTRLAALALLAVKPEVFGDAEEWTTADVRGVGILLIGLPNRVVQSIPAESFLGMTSSVAAALPESFLEALSADQAGFIPRFSAQSMSDNQVNAVSDEAREKLNAVLQGPLISEATVRLVSPLNTFLSLFLCSFAARFLL